MGVICVTMCGVKVCEIVWESLDGHDKGHALAVTPNPLLLTLPLPPPPPPSLLCSEHRELSEEVCEEMMTRQLECCDPVIQLPVLRCLVPWMENLTMDPRSWQVWRGGGRRCGTGVEG